jgi:N-acetylmuramoyl-L-alanine amidase
MIKICLDAGHGGKDPGASYGGVAEKDVTLQAVLRIRSILVVAKFIEPILTRETDVYIEPWKRPLVANEAKADYLISLHTNAAGEPGDNTKARGEEIWVKPSDTYGRKYAEIISDWVDMTFPNEPFRGIKWSNSLAVLKHSKVPANLIELAFINNSESNRRFSKQRDVDDMAIMIALGVFNVVHEIVKDKKAKSSSVNEHNG